MIKRDLLKEFKAQEVQNEFDQKRKFENKNGGRSDRPDPGDLDKVKQLDRAQIGWRDIYNYVNIVQETIDPDGSDNEDDVELVQYTGQFQSNVSFTQIGHFIQTNLLAMAVLKRIKIRINSTGKVTAKELKSQPVLDGEVNQGEGRQIKDSESSSIQRTYYTFKEKKTSEEHLETVIKKAIEAEKAVKGSSERSGNDLA